LDGGADGEITLRENCRAFEDITFRPRQGVWQEQCDLQTRVLDFNLSFPAILAPVGYSRMMHPGGEVAAASAAGAAGTAYILSTISGHKLEDVRAGSTGPVWYQLYLVGGRPVAELALERARKCGFSALIVTVDTAVAGMRERDSRNGMKELLSGSVLAKLPFLHHFLAHPRWLAAFLLDGGLPVLENIVVPGKGPMRLVDVGAALADPWSPGKTYVGCGRFGPAVLSLKESSPEMTRDALWTKGRQPSWFRITEDVSSMAYPLRFGLCRKL